MPNFDKLIGNEKIKRELTETMEKQKVSHSYMFVGKSGIGKSPGPIYIFYRRR